MKFNILVVDDERNIREGLATALEMEGYATATAANGKEAMEIIQADVVDLVITDLRMPEKSGHELLQFVVQYCPSVPVIILTGHGTIETAVQSMHEGAYDFVTKPVNLDRLSLLVRRALSNRELALQHRAMQEELEKQRGFKDIIGKSPVMRKVYDVVQQVAPTKASVLITGESGVGKELIANAIHATSPRKNKPLIRVHCAALSESLLESELFGHEKGSFTGATARKRGR
ncbi:MAG: sigma-54-dependent transcriptional regulator, partial [Spirochaeta sp.]